MGSEKINAVTAVLSLPWSNGQIEGHITKLKLVKRQSPVHCRARVPGTASRGCGNSRRGRFIPALAGIDVADREDRPLERFIPACRE